MAHVRKAYHLQRVLQRERVLPAATVRYAEPPLEVLDGRQPLLRRGAGPQQHPVVLLVLCLLLQLRCIVGPVMVPQCGQESAEAGPRDGPLPLLAFLPLDC